MTTVALDIALARKILTLIDHGLTAGMGRPEPGQMCVEAAICYALGEPHGDKPSCVAPVVRMFKVALNDKAWSSDAARAKGLRRVAIAQLGSRGVVDESRFYAIVVEQTIRCIVPIALRAAAERVPAHRESLLAAALRCELEGTKDAAKNADTVARATYDATYAAATDAATTTYGATYTATYGATYASTYCAAANAAANAAADAAADATDAARAAKRDEVLTIAAEIIVEALRECGSPGVTLMDEVLS